MRGIYIIAIGMILIGCGGGGGSSTNSTSASYITATLVDSAISGVGYECGNDSGITDTNGQFRCVEGSTVYFTLGGIQIGTTSISSATSYITPATIYGVDSNNITDTRVTNFLQLMQSLDDDNDPQNGIQITQSTRDSMQSKSLDISSQSTTLDNVKDIVQSVNKTLTDKNKAITHYVDTLSKTLNITLQDEPLYNEQWYLHHDNDMYTNNSITKGASINGEDILKQYTGKGIKIAIIDDGYDTTHEDLSGAIINSYDINTNSTNVSHTLTNEYHGTSVAGIIGARVNGKGIRGIASSSDMILLKMSNNATDSETIELLNKAQEYGADIINCSWGTNNVSQTVKEKIEYLAKYGRNGKGMIIVFASGNEATQMGNDESNIPAVISVGASDKENLRAWYSNYGENLDIIAPGGVDGTGITTLDDSSSNGIAQDNSDYLKYNDSNSFVGTSASAPIVTGIIALMLEKNPNLTRDQIEDTLKSTADKIGNLPYINYRNNFYGFGKVNVDSIFKSI